MCGCVTDVCLSPLGMESGEISDERIAASSQYNPSWSPFRSRLNYHDNGWTPSEDSAREWIQVQTHTQIQDKTCIVSDAPNCQRDLFTKRSRKGRRYEDLLKLKVKKNIGTTFVCAGGLDGAYCVPHYGPRMST